MKEESREEIENLYQQGDWKSVLCHPSLKDSLLMWVEPQLEDLVFLRKITEATESTRIVSVGAGCGLLEWLLKAAVGVEVIGLEIDSKWWRSPYSPPSFIPLVFPEDERFFDLAEDENSALMFCYFNNGPAFNEYLNRYKGNCVIIIGSERHGVHTDPKPFDLQNSSSGWSLYSSKKISLSNDIMVVYTRNKCSLQ
ncbi:unnamed protein product [Bemisia tabaci]|uniref:Uncharacterized protein n=1 Tax=Bemisia tabaci TaxID=7038 RepID=A0AAI8Y636_BEMTA|nr:unnamed protein product [Bemisia tabaci]